MSHEIRTPMTAILGYADLIFEEHSQNATIRESVATIKRNGEHLLTIINDILDLSKIESGKLVIELVSASVRQITAEVIELLRVRAVQKDLHVTAQFDSDVPHAILTDPTRLRQILVNLIGNAIKFTERGGVHIRVRRDGDRGPVPLLYIQIDDTGIGMTAEQMASLFQVFQQADGSTSRRFGGTGLGLAISRRLATMLGGSIVVSSELGVGSTFTLLVEARPAPDFADQAAASQSPLRNEQVAPTQALVRLAGVRVLFVEDSPNNQKLGAILLRKEGAEVTIAENGTAACQFAFDALKRGEPFHVVLMDMQMPLLDGYQATAELRRQGYALPVIAFTAHSMAEDRQKCLDAGCDDYLTKPIDRKRLTELVWRWSRHAVNSGRAAAEQTGARTDADVGSSRS
jgi:CheY-like chemotaxis protein